ncbi:hypothetical protein HWD16_gp45 [Microbacterium phage Arete]|uniref:Uncharacterized protein n=1 Tax=Microbacterium phage Arete TaxID=2713257 RepID=A0A6G8R1U0_9CAUD|nr:hypothetical protein HWD16_gp45 [Microbacterium phage Arete]QIN93928.1 hypothetical protein SEA_ARETE_45 [Microbacterium phage Arete]
MSDVNTQPVEGEEPQPGAEDAETAGELYEGSADSFFSAVMGTFEAPEDPDKAGEGTAEAGAAAGGDGSPAAAGEGAGAGEGAAAAPDAGAGGKPAVAPGAGDQPAAADAAQPEGAGAGFTRDAAEFNDNWSAVLTGLEERETKELTTQAVTDVKTEYANYIEAVEQAPRYLVGKTVPRADGAEGTETLRDAADAREWQDEIKKQLAREVQSRVQQGRDANRNTMEVLTNSIEVFRGNPDILPGAKQFDKELATRVADLVRPYAVKTADDKMAGWSIDVRPLIISARQALAAERAAKPTAPAKAAEPTAQQQRAAQQPREQGKFAGHPADAPQAGISSQAGQSGDDGESLDALFGTLGFPAGTFRF